MGLHQKCKFTIEVDTAVSLEVQNAKSMSKETSN